MKKYMINFFLLTLAAFLISTKTVATNAPLPPLHAQEQNCKDFWGLERLLNQSVSYDDRSEAITIKFLCSDKKYTSNSKKTKTKLNQISSVVNYNKQGGSL